MLATYLPSIVPFEIHLMLFFFFQLITVILLRFECRWSAVKIHENENKEDVWFRGMGGSVLGVWVAHGEGRFTVADGSLLDKLYKNGQVAVQYVDDDGKPTEVYPMNPNGSPGIPEPTHLFDVRTCLTHFKMQYRFFSYLC